MKITASQLRTIIKEETKRVLSEAEVDVSADTMKVIEDFVKTLRDADPTVTLGKIQQELDAAFRRDKSARTSTPEQTAARRSAAGVKAAASRKASDAFHKDAAKRLGPTWPGQLHGAAKPAGWKKSDYVWDDAEGSWVKK